MQNYKLIYINIYIFLNIKYNINNVWIEIYKKFLSFLCLNPWLQTLK